MPNNVYAKAVKEGFEDCLGTPPLLTKEGATVMSDWSWCVLCKSLQMFQCSLQNCPLRYPVTTTETDTAKPAPAQHKDG